VGKLEERSQQLKEKWPGYGAILDFYVKVRMLQDASRTSLHLDSMKVNKAQQDRSTEEGSPLVQKEDFPVVIESSVNLFQSLCQLGRKANSHIAAQVEKIDQACKDKKLDPKKLFTSRGKEQIIKQVATDLGLDRQVLLFLVQSSTMPSIEAGMEQLRDELKLETCTQSNCPVCGSLPKLSLLKGEGGMRYSLCSYCSFQWRISRLSCSVCGNKEQDTLKYFCAEGEEAYRIELCDKCHYYIKTIDYRNLEESDPSLEDLATLHLDVMATQKGYTRAVPCHLITFKYKEA